jgi:hypothetical protein
MKKVLMVLVLAVILLVAVGCSSYQGKAKEPLIAKVRYFDGSLDTLEITEWRTVGAAITFRSIDGVTTTTGANNVIIIKGDKGE